jgi:hypothetical protein
MAFMFLRKTICVDFDSSFWAKIAGETSFCYLCGYKFFVLLLSHVFRDFDFIARNPAPTPSVAG